MFAEAVWWAAMNGLGRGVGGGFDKARGVQRWIETLRGDVSAAGVTEKRAARRLYGQAQRCCEAFRGAAAVVLP